MPTAAEPSPSRAPLDAYQKKLFVFLAVATFFEGYDFLALTQILPNLRKDFGLPIEAAGLMVTVVNLGTVLAYLMVRKADAWGRRRVLTWTIVGYTTFTFLTGFAPEVVSFALLQLVARIFLIGEWAVSFVIAAEEFPAERRGTIIGVISGAASLGSVACAGVVPLLLKTPWGWRTVYFVGIVPLIILAVMRRGLKETRRFAEQVGEKPVAPSLLRIWSSPFRRRMLQLGAIWFLTYIGTQNGITFFKEFALAERGMTDKDVGGAIAIAAVVAMPLVFGAGKLIDVIGRRRGALLIFTTVSVGVFAAFNVTSPVGIKLALIATIFGTSAVLPVLNAYTTELFPTELRGDAFAWSNNLIGRVGYVISPTFVALAAAQTGWGPALSVTALSPLLALALILVFMPETRARELEDTAKA